MSAMGTQAGVPAPASEENSDSSPVKTILVIYHSQSGHTEQMARAVAGGAAEMEGVRAELKRACDAGLDDLLGCDGLIVGSPEYFGYMAGAVKDFFDRTYEAGHEDSRAFRKPCAAFVHAGNDGSGALASIERICRGYKFKAVMESFVARGEITPEVLARCAEMGATMAAGCAAGIY